jgi:SAM-dependent methyltransferase
LVVERSLQRIPKVDSPSRALSKMVEKLSDVRMKILDAPCGYGRNALWLTSLGHDVVCVDYDQHALRAIDRHVSTLTLQNKELGKSWGTLSTVHCDLFKSDWPFGREAFDAIINVDFVAPSLFAKFTYSLTKNGLFFFETFGNRGGNFLGLPKSKEIEELLRRDYAFEFYKERPAGPVGIDAVVVCLLARKHSFEKL